MAGLLEPVGMTGVESELYLQLVSAPRRTASELAIPLGVTAGRLRRPLTRLTEAGLITRLTGSPVRYMPAPPDVAVDALVLRRQEALEGLRARARGLARQLQDAPRGRATDMIELVEGERGVVHHVVAIQLAAQDEVAIVDCPPYLHGGAGNPQEVQSMRRGVRYRGIYHAPVLEDPARMADLMANIAGGELARVLPSVHMKMIIADRRVALIPCSFEAVELRSVILVHSSPLLTALMACFEYLWERAIPVGGNHPRGGGLSDSHREMLAMLAAGMKDRAMARALGITERSVTRRINQLLNTLGAETRFQAALQAAKRGWL